MSEVSLSRQAPFWHRTHLGEQRWPVTAVVLVVILLQVSLPSSLNIKFPLAICGIEFVLLVWVTAMNPKRISEHLPTPRTLGLLLAALMTVCNLVSTGRLVTALMHGGVTDANSLVFSGGAIWFSNVVVFALWYWEFDRGGPGARAQARHQIPDFMFPQMSDPDLAAPHWATKFFDYLYISFTNASAFSPTDVMPLTRWAKALMLVQSVTSLIVVALVIARGVNILH
ncbi:MAG: hypothetical protein WCK30_04230 [Actinomycetes bacterium]